MVLQTINGYPELILMEACDVQIFYATAKWLSEKLSIVYSQQIYQGENLRWEFLYPNALMTLLYNSATGVRICPAACEEATEADKAAFKELTLTLDFA